MTPAPYIDAPAEHGTRARYVRGCRCDACRAANLDAYHQRRAEVRARAHEVTPTGPPIPSTLVRAGRTVSIHRCPGANGDPCVRTPATWLKGQVVCTPCVERALVWNGLVPASPARKHLLRLRREGVGYKAVADACDVASTVLADILSGSKTRIRAQTLRRVLEVDAAALADHAVVPVARTRELVEDLLRRGFTKAHIDELLGGRGRSLQRGLGDHVLAKTAQRVEAIHGRALRGELAPVRRGFVRVSTEVAFVRTLAAVGVPAAWLRRQLGSHPRALGDWARPERAAALKLFVRELEEGGDSLDAFRAMVDEQLGAGRLRLPESWWTDEGHLRVPPGGSA